MGQSHTTGKRKRFTVFCERFAAWFALVLFALLGLLSLLFTARMEQDEEVFFLFDRFYITLPLVLCVAALLWLCHRLRLWEKVHLGRLRLVLAAWVLVLGTTWVFMARSTPFADAQVVYEFAQRFVGGDFDPIAEGYLGHYPHQLTLALYYELVMWLTGTDSYIFLQMINVGNVALSYLVLTYLAGEMFASKRVQWLCCLLLFGLAPPVLYVTFIYGTQPGLTAALFAVYCTLRFLRGGRARWLAPAVGAATLAVLFKLNYWIFVIGILLVLVLEFGRRPGRAVAIAAACMLLACLLAPQGVYKLYELRSGHTVQGGVPTSLHIAMGMQEGERGPGWFNGYTNEQFDGVNKNYAEAKERASADIAARLSEFGHNPLYALEFYGRKIISQWCDPSFAAIQVSYFGGGNTPPLGAIPTRLYWGGLRAPAEGYMEVYLLLAYGGALCCFVLRRKQLDLAALLPAIIFIGGFLFHLLWEAKSQYCWPYFVLCIPYAAAGLCSVFQKVEIWVARHTGLPSRAVK